MNKLKPSILFAGTLLTLMFLASCANNSRDPNAPDPEVTRGAEAINAIKQDASMVAESSFNSVYVYKNGVAEDTKPGDEEKEAAKNGAFMVMFDRNVSWAADIENGIFGKTTNPEFNKIVADNNLKIIKLFELDESQDGIVLRSNNPINNPEEIVKAMSLIEGVSIVHLKAPGKKG